MHMKVDCPTCKQSIQYDTASPFRPFCSKRCQLIDLGEWADEKHAIPERNEPEKLILDPEDIEAMLAQQGDDFFKC